MNSIWTSRGVRRSQEVCPNACQFICQACSRVYRCPLLHGTGTAPRCASGHFMGRVRAVSASCWKKRVLWPLPRRCSCGAQGASAEHFRDSMARSEIQRNSMCVATKLRVSWTALISSCSWKGHSGIRMLFVTFWKICYLLPYVYRTLLKLTESWRLEMSGGILSSNRKLGVITAEAAALFSSEAMSTTAVWEPQGRELLEGGAKRGQMACGIGKAYEVICLQVVNSSAAQDVKLAKIYSCLQPLWYRVFCKLVCLFRKWRWILWQKREKKRLGKQVVLIY